MTTAYPLSLRTILRTSKSRSQPAAFRMIEPRRGFAYTQESGTDTPVFWDVIFKFTPDESLVFDLWFRQILRRGVDPFILGIRTEYGVVDHECRFVPDGLLDLSEGDGMFSYKATIMARAMVIPQQYIDAAELIVTLPDWTDWAGLLDRAMTVEMPA